MGYFIKNGLKNRHLVLLRKPKLSNLHLDHPRLWALLLHPIYLYIYTTSIGQKSQQSCTINSSGLDAVELPILQWYSKWR